MSLTANDLVNEYPIIKEEGIDRRCSGKIILKRPMKWLFLHNFFQPRVTSDYAHVENLLAVCQRLTMVRISDNGPGRKEG